MYFSIILEFWAELGLINFDFWSLYIRFFTKLGGLSIPVLYNWKYIQIYYRY